MIVTINKEPFFWICDKHGLVNGDDFCGSCFMENEGYDGEIEGVSAREEEEWKRLSLSLKTR